MADVKNFNPEEKQKKFSRTPSKFQKYLIEQNISQETIAQNTFQSVRTVSQIAREGKGSNSSKELIRLYLKLDKEAFYELLGQEVPTVGKKKPTTDS